MVPTLNLGDNTGDTRATVLIYVEPIGTLQARDYKGVNHEGARDGKLVIMETDPIVFYGNRVDDIRIQGDVINTLQARMGTGGGNMPIVALQGNMIGRADTAGPQGKGFTDENDPMFTLTKTDVHAVAFDTYNQSVSPISKTLNSAASDVDHTGALWQGSVVRRLTPMECERLQGFPDNWTEGQADSHRYKQMGNAVAVPVVEWIVKRLMEAK